MGCKRGCTLCADERWRRFHEHIATTPPSLRAAYQQELKDQEDIWRSELTDPSKGPWPTVAPEED